MTYRPFRRTFRLALIGSTMALALSACGGTGTSRIASIGSVPDDSTSASNGGTGGSGGATDPSGSGGTSASNGGGSGTGTGSGSGSGSGTGTGGGSGSGSGTLGGPVLVTAGNAVIGLGNKHAGLAQTINGELPATGPVTGIVTAVLRKSGQTLVDLGNGRSAVLNRAGGAVGKLVSIDLGTGRVVGAPGATSLIGVSALTPTQLANVAVANPVSAATTGVVGKVGTIASSATGVLTGGGATPVSGGLLSGSAAGGGAIGGSLLGGTLSGGGAAAGGGSVALPVTAITTPVTTATGAVLGKVKGLHK